MLPDTKRGVRCEWLLRRAVLLGRLYERSEASGARGSYVGRSSWAACTSEARRQVRVAPTIGVGKPHWIAAPLPPNRTGGFPASGFPVDS